MKSWRILQAFCVCAGMAGLQAEGQNIYNIYKPGTSDPNYSDFDASSVNINYTAGVLTDPNASTDGASNGGAIGEFVITTHADSMNYLDGPDAPGTQGAYNNSGGGTGFTGTYSLTAYIEEFGGNWEVIDPTVNSVYYNSQFTITGNLPDAAGFPSGIDGVTVGATSDVLLQANLKTGANTLGWNTQGSYPGVTFNFLFNVSGGNSAIVADYFGADTGAGGIIASAGNYNAGAGVTAFSESTTFTVDFGDGTSGRGNVDSFVPEPSAYPIGAGIVAAFFVTIVNRKQPRTYTMAAASK